MPHPERPRTAVVLSGGGARGAYEAGVLHYLRSALPDACRDARFGVLSGTSVGAINAAFLAATAHTPRTQGRMLRDLWENVQEGRIFLRDWPAVGRFVLEISTGLARSFLRFDPGKQRRGRVSRKLALFDTAPLPDYLDALIDFPAITRNLASGELDALALTATNLDTNLPELFVQKRPEVAYHGDYRVHETTLAREHVMASAAIPFAFPPVKLGASYYCDGGVRMNTPMSPAIQLGAERLLVIGAHARTERRFPAADGDEYPSPGRLLAAVTDGVFQDKIRSDLQQLGRINRIIQWAQEVFDGDFLRRLNDHVLAAGETGDIASRGLKKIEALSVFPSRDLGELFQEQLDDNPYLDESFSAFERFAMRLFAVDPREGRELFSYLVFAPKYVRALLDLGYEDARARHGELVSFCMGGSLPMKFPQIVPASARLS